MEEQSDMIQNTDIGNRIRCLCVQKGISYTALAGRADISIAALYQIMSGKANPRLSTLQLICKALGISLEYLFSTYRENVIEVKEDDLVYLISRLNSHERWLVKQYVDLLFETRYNL